MIPLDEEYNEIIDPTNFVKRFPDKDSFIAWCNMGTIKDLRCTIQTFEKYELYEHCSMIKWVIDRKKDNILIELGLL